MNKHIIVLRKTYLSESFSFKQNISLRRRLKCKADNEADFDWLS
jgi:hypothetical protein